MTTLPKIENPHLKAFVKEFKTTYTQSLNNSKVHATDKYNDLLYNLRLSLLHIKEFDAEGLELTYIEVNHRTK